LVLVVLPLPTERVVPGLAALALSALALAGLALAALIRPPGWKPSTAPPGRVCVVPGCVAVLAAPAVAALAAALAAAAPSEPRARTAAANGIRQRKVNAYSQAVSGAGPAGRLVVECAGFRVVKWQLYSKIRVALEYLY
jgi:hypothetical protein